MWIAGSAPSSGRRRGRSVASSKVDSLDRQYIGEVCDVDAIAMLEAHGTEASRTAEQCYGHLLGLALLRYAGPWVNSLTQMGPERRAMANWFGGQLQDMHFFEVSRVVCLHDPELATHHGFGLTCPKHLLFTITPECAERSLARPSIGPGAVVGGELQAWLASEALRGHPRRPNTVLQLPHPIAELVAHGSWVELALNCRARCVEDSDVRHFWRSLPERRSQWQAMLGDAQVDRLGPSEDSTAVASNTFDARMFQDLAFLLRSYNSGEADPSSKVARPLVAEYVMWLEHCARSARPEVMTDFAWAPSSGRGGRWNAEAGSHGGFTCLFLIQVILLSFSIRGLSSESAGIDPLGIVIRRAIRTFAPVVRSYLDQVLASFRYPSAAVICRARFFLDVAWMLWCRRTHKQMVEERAVVFGMMDSSPQGVAIVSMFMCPSSPPPPPAKPPSHLNACIPERAASLRISCMSHLQNLMSLLTMIVQFFQHPIDPPAKLQPFATCCGMSYRSGVCFGVVFFSLSLGCALVSLLRRRAELVVDGTVFHHGQQSRPSQPSCDGATAVRTSGSCARTSRCYGGMGFADCGRDRASHFPS